MPTFLFLAGFLTLVFLLVRHWDKLKKRDAELNKKKELDHLLGFDEADCYN